MTPAGGVRRYATELFAAIQVASPETELVAIGGHAVPAGVLRTRAASLVPTNLGWCAAGLPLAARRAAFDVFHAPAYTGPLWGVHPLVITIHDVSYARRPEWSPHPRGRGPASAGVLSRVRASCRSRPHRFDVFEIRDHRGLRHRRGPHRCRPPRCQSTVLPGRLSGARALRPPRRRPASAPEPGHAARGCRRPGPPRAPPGRLCN